MNKQKVFFLAGPTASGKTESAICLAGKLNAEIISCDSMQIYKGMDIITSKPARSLRKKIRHHLVDILPPVKEYDVSCYRRDALKKIEEVLKRGKTPLFVGGTGLYISILADGIFKVNRKNQAIRKRLYQEAKIKGSTYLYNRLKRIDPEAALKIHPHDARRIIRALEVFKITGKPISALWKERCGLAEKYDVKIFCLDLKRDQLYKKIDQRVEKMFKAGLLKEAKKLLKLKLSKTSCYAIGIRELKDYFNGLSSLDEAKCLIKRNTRNYAKRQLTWFRKDKRIKWIKVASGDQPRVIAQKIWKELS